jgi:hypothetical protein
MQRNVLLRTGLGGTGPAKVWKQDGQAGTLNMDPEFNIRVSVELSSKSSTGFVRE